MDEQTATAGRKEGSPVPAVSVARPRSRALVRAGLAVTAIGAAGVGASVPGLVSGADPLAIAAVSGSAVVTVVGAALIQRGRARRAVPAPTTPETVPVVAVTPLGRRIRQSADVLAPARPAAPRTTIFPPPPPGAQPERSPLPVRVPDDASALVGAEASDLPPLLVPDNAPTFSVLVPDAALLGRQALEPTDPAIEPARPLFADPAHADTPLGDAVSSAGGTVVERYRQWVLEQAMGEAAFAPLEIDGDRREVFLLSSCGVATLLAWLHEQHRTTCTVDKWVDEILPGQGIEIADRELAIELLIAAALYAGGIHSAPTTRLRAYHPSDLITAMATMHVGLLRLYCGLGERHPAAIVGQQFDEGS